MVFRRNVRIPRNRGTMIREKTFPVFRIPAGDVGQIDEEIRKLEDLRTYEETLLVLRNDVEAYYAGKTDLEDVLQAMMDSGLCHKLSKLE